MLRPLNIFWLFRWPIMIKQMNSFKYILEEILKNTKNQNVSLCPDDMIYFKNTEIDNEVFNLLRENGDDYQYRYFTSNKFKKPHNLPEKLKIKYHKEKNHNHFFHGLLKTSMLLEYGNIDLPLKERFIIELLY